MASSAGTTGANPFENSIVNNALTTRMYSTALYAVVLWDWFTTLRLEYDRIWKTNWTVVKFLFLWLRYITIAGYAVSVASFDGNWSTETCTVLHYFAPAIGLAIMLPAEAILLMRCWAIWQRNWIILGLGMCGLCIFTAGQLLTIVHTVPLTLPPPLTHFACIATEPSGQNQAQNAKGYGYLLGNPIWLDCFLTTLTVTKTIRHALNGARSDVLRTFAADSLLYFCFVTAANVANLVTMLQPNPSLQPINLQLVVIVTSLAAQRLVLHLRRHRDVHYSKTMSGPSWRRSSFSQRATSATNPSQMSSAVHSIFGRADPRRPSGNPPVISELEFDDFGERTHYWGPVKLTPDAVATVDSGQPTAGIWTLQSSTMTANDPHSMRGFPYPAQWQPPLPFNGHASVYGGPARPPPGVAFYLHHQERAEDGHQFPRPIRPARKISEDSGRQLHAV